MHVLETSTIGANGDQMQVLLVRGSVLGHRFAGLVEDLETQVSILACSRGSLDWGKYEAVRACGDPVQSGLRSFLRSAAVSFTVCVHVTSFCPCCYEAVRNDGAGKAEGPAERHHQPGPVERKPSSGLHQTRTAE